jgi:hypothetical protein
MIRQATTLSIETSLWREIMMSGTSTSIDGARLSVLLRVFLHIYRQALRRMFVSAGWIQSSNRAWVDHRGQDVEIFFF